MDVYELYERSRCNTSICTLEATVPTGFEAVALIEATEKLGDSLDICKARGRIFLNINICNAPLVLNMRSVDNVFVVAHADGTNYINNGNKDEDTELVKKLAHCPNWEKAISLWSSITQFQGICYPTQLQYDNSYIIENKIKDEVKSLLQANEDLMPSIDEENSTHNLSEVLHDPVMNEGNCKGEAKSYTFYSNPRLTSRKLYKMTDNRPPSETVMKYRVTCYRSGKHSFASQEAAHHFGGVLQDKFHWIVDLVHYDMEIVLNIKAENVYATIALTKESMHRRNINHFGPTTLRSTVCYNMLHLGEPKPGDVVIDPLCGGGSISIEGALGFPGTFHICGDIHPKAIDRSRANVDDLESKMKNNIDVLSWSVNKLPLKDSSVDLFVTDLPFGKRSGSKQSNNSLYKDVLLELARVIRRITGRAVLLTHDKSNLMKALHQTHGLWSLAKIVGVNLGGLDAGTYVLNRTDTDVLTVCERSSSKISRRKKKMRST